MKANPRPLLLSAALSAVLLTSLPALAQDSGSETDADVVAEATVPADRLAERYADLAGSEEAAADLVSALRTGGDFTVTEEVTSPVLDANGDPVLDANGDPKTTTSLVDTTIANPNGPMGYGEVNITLSIAQALVDGGQYPDLQSALTGTSSTVTNADGTTTTTTTGGVLAMRAEGMGWGQIAKELGFKLGSLVSASVSNGKSKAGAHTATTESEHGHVAKTEHGRVAKADRPSRPEKLARAQKPDRPLRPERPARPDKPERGGGRP